MPYIFSLPIIRQEHPSLQYNVIKNLSRLVGGRNRRI